MSELTARLIVPALNHVLSSEPWAVARLQPYAGKSLLIAASPIELRLCISANGLFSAADGQSEPPAVTITLPDDTTFKVLSGNQAALLLLPDFRDRLNSPKLLPLSFAICAGMSKPTSLQSLEIFQLTEASLQYKILLRYKNAALQIWGATSRNFLLKIRSNSLLNVTSRLSVSR
jgi:hypothetical protein